jgi:translation initiation factor 5
VLLTLCLQLKKYRILFLRFTHEDPKAQKYLLGGIEQVIALHKDNLLPKVPGIFKVIIFLATHLVASATETQYMQTSYS